MTEIARQPPRGNVEEAVGTLGRFIVYYRRDGKTYWDALWSPTAEQAEADLLSMAEEIGWGTVEVERVEVRTLAPSNGKDEG